MTVGIDSPRPPERLLDPKEPAVANAMKKMAVYLGLVEEPERTYAYDDEPADGYTRAVESQRRDAAPVAVATDRRIEAPITTAAMPVVEQYRIVTLHPRSYNDARTIGIEFRDGVPVIMNLTDMDDADAKRLVDFAAGLVFAQRGTIERVTPKVFLLSPANVDVSDQAKARVAEGGFFNQS
jgi:cell division inhibitor SepF